MRARLLVASIVFLIPATVVAYLGVAVSGGDSGEQSWKQSCIDWSTRGFVLTATCRDSEGGERLSSLNLLSCAQPPNVETVDGALACTEPGARPVAGSWSRNCSNARIVERRRERQIVAFCATADGNYLTPASLNLGDCNAPVRVGSEDGQLFCESGASTAAIE